MLPLRSVPCASSVLTLLCAMAAAFSQSSPSAPVVVPRYMSFTGELKNRDGKPAEGTVTVTFLLYDQESGGSPLWTETQRVTLDSAGSYNVTLGANTSGGLPAELFATGQARWLEIEPEGLPIHDRVLLLSVPYALKAGDAETLAGLPASAFLRAPAVAPGASAGSIAPPGPVPNLTSIGGTANYVPLWTPNGSTLGNSTLYQSGTGTTAKIGINKTNPQAALDVQGGAIVRGILRMPNTATATNTKAANSQPLALQASVFSSSTQLPVTPQFHFMAEAQGNNTPNPGATLNLLYGTTTIAETGLRIAGNGQITFAPGQTFPGTGTGNGTITGVTAGTGLTGGGTSGNVTVTLDTTKVPVLAASNTFSGNQTVNGNLGVSGTLSGSTLNAASASFTGPVTFSSGQTFPGTLTQAAADARYPQLATNNSYAGNQVVNGAVGIGISPLYPLHVSGVMRSENGLSLGGSAPLSVDAPFIPGGHFLVNGTGKVGINNASPKSALDVTGDINASGSLNGSTVKASSGLSIGSDPAMSAAPRMYITGYIPPPMPAGAYFRPINMTPSKNITITRMTVGGWNPCSQSASQSFALFEGTSIVQTITVSTSVSNEFSDSGPLSIGVAAGVQLLVSSNGTPSCPFGSQPPGDLTVTLEYIMQ